MNTALKTRLVGAAVLLILSGLLWPILFDFDESMQISHESVEVPPAPPQVKKTVSTDEVVPQSAAAFEEADTLADVVVETVKAKPVEVNESKPSLDANHIPVSYVVQVGTFSRWSNAVALRDKILDQKLKAYLRPETSVQKGPYVVAIGPYLTKAEAREAKAKIKQQFNLNDAIVRRF